MGIYLSQLRQAFTAVGVQCRTLDYRRLSSLARLALLLGPDKESVVRSVRTKLLVAEIKAHSPNIVFTVTSRLDFPVLRSAFDGTMIYWDMDGPAGALVDPGFPWNDGIDLVLTVSRVMERGFHSGPVPVRYLPHGVDPEFFSNGPVSSRDRRRFAASIAFVGRTCPRRAALLVRIADMGLVLWGQRWSRNNEESRGLRRCVREDGDILGKDLVSLYRSSGVMLNILQQTFALQRTILSLQAFSIPSTETCLLTDWAEELDEAFEPEKEVAVFRSPDEFVEKARRYSQDQAAARALGEAGRRRCVAHHSLQARARQILDLAGYD
jgi:glycosyltransferase involved in cell wall biosynthesis